MSAAGPTREAILDSVGTLLDDDTGVVLTGDIGVGKSYLAEMIASSRTMDHVEVLIGSPTIRRIPFAATAHLVPDQAVSDPLRLLQLVRQALQNRARGRRLVVVVDDLDQVDSGTAALIHQMVLDKAAAVVATVRSAQAGMPEIAALWKDDHLVRVEVPPLTREEQEELITALAPTRVLRPMREKMWRLAEGNPLFVKEVLLAIEASGPIDTGAPLGDVLLDSSRLRDQVERRLDGLSEEERTIVTSIALTEPLDAGVLHRLFAAETLTAVEALDLVRTDRTKGGLVYRTAHPLLSELLRSGLSPGVRDKLLVAVVAAMRDTAQLDPARDFRIASWLLEAGLPVEPTLARQATLAALRVFDAESGARFAAAALADERDLAGLLIYGNALSQLGQVTEADVAFLEAEAAATGDVELAAVTVLRGMNLIHRGGRVEEGVALLHERAGDLVDPIARADVESMLMQGEGVAGDFSRSLTIGPALAEAARGGGVAELRLLVSLSVARVVTGRLENAEAEVERGLVVADGLAHIYPVEAEQMLLGKLLLLLTEPQIDEGLSLVLERLAGSSGAGEAPWHYFASWLLSAAGRLGSAQRSARDGVESLEASDPIGLRPLALGAHAMVHAQAGAVEQAEMTLARVLDDPRSGQPRAQMFVSRAQAWLAARSRGPQAGAEIAARQGEFLASASHETWGAWTAYDAVRLGHAEVAKPLLDDIAAASGDGAVHLFAAHATAYVSDDADALGAAAKRWELAGAWAHAAEANAHAAEACSSDTRSARHRQRAIVIGDECDGLWSPVLDSLKAPLSLRQAEVAARAATSQTSQAIAEEFFLSRRTVDNHLGSVYALLGLDGRAELEEIFGSTHSVADQYSSTF